MLTKLDELKSLHFELATNHKVHAVTGDFFFFFWLAGGLGGGARREQGHPVFGESAACPVQSVSFSRCSRIELLLAIGQCACQTVMYIAQLIFIFANRPTWVMHKT